MASRTIVVAGGAVVLLAAVVGLISLVQCDSAPSGSSAPRGETAEMTPPHEPPSVASVENLPAIPRDPPLEKYDAAADEGAISARSEDKLPKPRGEVEDGIMWTEGWVAQQLTKSGTFVHLDTADYSASEEREIRGLIKQVVATMEDSPDTGAPKKLQDELQRKLKSNITITVNGDTISMTPIGPVLYDGGPMVLPLPEE